MSALAVGDRVTMAGEKQTWTVRGVTKAGRFAILTKPYNPQRTVLYTVIDFQRGVRGRDNFYGLGYESDEQVSDALHAFQHTEDDDRTCDRDFCVGGAEVSYRTANHVRLDLLTINGEDVS